MIVYGSVRGDGTRSSGWVAKGRESKGWVGLFLVPSGSSGASSGGGNPACEGRKKKARSDSKENQRDVERLETNHYV